MNRIHIYPDDAAHDEENCPCKPSYDECYNSNNEVYLVIVTHRRSISEYLYPGYPHPKPSRD